MADPGAAIRANFDSKEVERRYQLLERMMDWNEVLDLLRKAEHHFNLGLTRKNGWIYLPIDGEQTEIKRSDFKVLRPTKSEEKELKLKEWEKTKI